MVRNDCVVIFQPLGRTPGVLEPPIAKFKPDVIVIFTSQQSYADTAIEHTQKTWVNHSRPAEVIVKIIEEPWNQDAIERYMKAFDDAVLEVNKSNGGKEIKRYVGTSGGTNLMAIASALSAFIYRYPVYSSLDAQHYAGKSAGELAIELKLFNNLGPAYKLLTGGENTLKILKYISEHPGTTNKSLEYPFDCSNQYVSRITKELKKCGLIISNSSCFTPTILAKLLLSQLTDDDGS